MAGTEIYLYSYFRHLPVFSFCCQLFSLKAKCCPDLHPVGCQQLKVGSSCEMLCRKLFWEAGALQKASQTPECHAAMQDRAVLSGC